MGEAAAARVDQIARVERIAIGLIGKCSERGASPEEILMGLIAACISCRGEAARPAQLEWIRKALESVERRMLKKAGGQWTH